MYVCLENTAHYGHENTGLNCGPNLPGFGGLYQSTATDLLGLTNIRATDPWRFADLFICLPIENSYLGGGGCYLVGTNGWESWPKKIWMRINWWLSYLYAKGYQNYFISQVDGKLSNILMKNHFLVLFCFEIFIVGFFIIFIIHLILFFLFKIIHLILSTRYPLIPY